MPWGAGGGAAEVAGTGAIRSLGALGLLVAPSTAGEGSDRITLFHGTSVESAVALLNGAPLSVEAIAALKIDGRPGFYLATNIADAEYFAARRAPGTILQYSIELKAVQNLMGAGATLAPIPAGGFKPAGNEFVVPPSAFPLFDNLRRSGSITVAPAKF